MRCIPDLTFQCKFCRRERVISAGIVSPIASPVRQAPRRRVPLHNKISISLSTEELDDGAAIRPLSAADGADSVSTEGEAAAAMAEAAAAASGAEEQDRQPAVRAAAMSAVRERHTQLSTTEM